MRCVLALVVLSFALSCHRASAAPIDAAAVYAKACAACHGDDGRGRAAAEVGFTQPLPDFTDCDFATREQDGDWGAIVHRGGPVRAFARLMPAFEGALGDDEIAAAIAHLHSFCTDARWPRGELNLPRALFTEKAYPEDEAVITTTLVTDGPNSLTHQFLWEQRFGALNQIEIGVPITRADLGEPEGYKSGTGDLAIGVKHTLRHSLDRGAILAVGGELSLPTGDEAKGFGAGTSVLEGFALYGKLLPRDSFVQLQGIVEMPRDAALENELVVRAAVGRTFATDSSYGRTWTPMVEVLGARELEGGAATEWDIAPQFQVSLSRRQHVQLGAGAKIPVTDRSNRTTELVVYLLWDWYDGGVLEGWQTPALH
jgi:hypothetical protein